DLPRDLRQAAARLATRIAAACLRSHPGAPTLRLLALCGVVLGRALRDALRVRPAACDEPLLPAGRLRGALLDDPRGALRQALGLHRVRHAPDVRAVICRLVAMALRSEACTHGRHRITRESRGRRARD